MLITTAQSIKGGKIGKNITYIGRLNKTKNVELLIEAFAQLDNTDANLTIAGPDYGELPMLKNLVQKLKIENRVNFTGWISEKEKIDLLSKTSIFVKHIPSMPFK